MSTLSLVRSKGADALVLPHDQFVGRCLEMAELRLALERVAAGAGCLFLVTGEPGIGKTRLAEQLAAEAGHGGFRVLWGRSIESGAAPAYWPWLQILRAYISSCDSQDLRAQLPTYARDLVHLLPEIAPHVEVAGVAPAELPPRSAQEAGAATFRLMDSLSSFLSAAANTQPLVLVFEDLHAADVATLRLLQFVTHELHNRRILIVANYRPAAAETNPTSLALLKGLSRHGVVLELLRWSAEEIRSFMNPLAALVSEEVTATIHGVTRGTPFFVAEIARGLMAEAAAGHAITPDTVRRLLPQRLRDVALQHLQPLPESIRDLLGLAAVGDGDVDLRLLEHVAAAAGHDGNVADAVRQAAAFGILTPTPDPTRYFFSQQLIRDALYDTLQAGRKVELHECFARALSALRGDSAAAEIAHHAHAAAKDWSSAKNAVAYSKLAGDHAMGCFAFDDAQAHYQRAAACIRRWQDPSTPAGARNLCSVLLDVAAAQRLSGEFDAADLTCAQVKGYAEEIGAVDLLVRAILPSDLNPAAAFATAQIHELEHALDDLGDGDHRLRARGLGALAVMSRTGSDLARRETLSREAVDLARRSGDNETLSYTLFARELALWAPDYMEERLATAREHLQLAEASGDLASMRHACGWLLLGALERGEMGAFNEALASFARINEVRREPYARFLAQHWQVQRQLLLGRLAAAQHLLTEMSKDGTDAAQAAALLPQWLQLRWFQGRVAELVPLLETVCGERTANPALRAMLAFALAESEQLQESLLHFEELAADGFDDVPRDSNWLAVMAMLAATCTRLRDQPRALRLCELLDPFANRVAVLGMAAGCWGSVAGYVARLRGELGDWDGAARYFDLALRLHEHMRSTPLVAQTQLDYAEMLQRAGECSASAYQADELFEAARSRADAIGMVAAAERASKRLAEIALQSRCPREADVPADDRVTMAIHPAQVFRREGEFWTVSFEGTTARFKHARGFAVLHYLLRNPGQEIHVIDLLHATDRTTTVRVISDAGELLDRDAQLDYRRRIRELQEELGEAQALNDAGHNQRCRAEIDFLTAELSRALGLGGRTRRGGSTTERARVNINRVLGLALKKITQHHAPLSAHLKRTLRTGAFCEYAPDPRVPITWEV